MRVKDETIVDPEDEEVLQDEMTDEFASYFRREGTPKVLITTCNRPKSHVSYVYSEMQSHFVPLILKSLTCNHILLTKFGIKLANLQNEIWSFGQVNELAL